MRKDKKETNKILFFGKRQNQMSPNGNLLGGKEDQAGILNVQLWQHPFLEKILIFTLEE
jgi:hypothetical protein